MKSSDGRSPVPWQSIRLTPLRAKILAFVGSQKAVCASDVAGDAIRGRNERSAKAQLSALHRSGLLVPIRNCEYVLSDAGRAWLEAQAARSGETANPRPPRRKFLVGLAVEVEVDQRLLDDVLTDEWRAQFYPDIRAPGDVAEHLAFNLVQGRRLSSLDGFADQSDERARVVDVEVDDPAVKIDA